MGVKGLSKGVEFCASLTSHHHNRRVKIQASPRAPKQTNPLPNRLNNVSSRATEQMREKLQDTEYKPGELLVKWKSGPALSSELASDYGGRIAERFDFGQAPANDPGQLVRMELPKGLELAQVLAAMQDDERIAYAETNEIYHQPEVSGVPPEDPNDLGPALWGLHNSGQDGGKPGADVHAREAWNITTGDGTDQGPIIAVIDGGIDYNHPDLRANMWVNQGEIPDNGIDDDGNGVVDDVYGFNAYANTGDPLDGSNGHGTHVAGTIGAVGNNGEGVTGVMQSARLMAVKIFSDEGRTDRASIVRGINYSAKMGARITNNSWGGGGASEAIKEAFANNPALHIAAAGNSGYDNDKRDAFPANYDLDNLMAVAATNRHDRLASFSQWGRLNVDVAAPGRDILSTFPDGHYRSLSGTSMATPHVSGVAGLIASAYPQASPEEIKARLIHGSDLVEELGHHSVSGGRVNAASSLEPDLVAPGVPRDFGAVEVSSRQAKIRWKTPADDGQNGGPVHAVELRVSNQPITEDNFEDAKIHANGRGDTVGERSELKFLRTPQTVPGETYFAAKAIDNVGNRSGLVSTKVEFPASQEAFREDFEGTTKFTSQGDFRKSTDPDKGVVFTTEPEDGKEPAELSTLTSPPLDLRGRKNAFLKMETTSHLYWGNEAVLQVSEDGEHWGQVHEFKRKSEWTETGVDLSAYDGKTIQLRFQLDSRWGRDRKGLTINGVQLLAEVETPRH